MRTMAHVNEFEFSRKALRRTKSVASIQAAILCLSVLASGCQSTPVPEGTLNAQMAAQKRADTGELNQKLAAAALKASVDDGALEQEYAIGAGDVLNVSVFGVEELNTTVRVSSRGVVILPLLGGIKIGGRSPAEVEDLVAERLTEYIHAPSVSVYVSEYHAQQVSVTGAVGQPALHTLTRPRTVMELLSMSGGLSPKAGRQIYVQTRIDGEPQRLIIDLEKVLLNPDNGSLRVVLRGGDVIFVPEAGTVFVEGAVNRPGAYQLEAKAGVIEAVAMAGGTKFAARENLVRVITRSDAGEPDIVSVDLDEVRANQVPNVELQDGDIVLVPESGAKAGFAGFWRGFTGIFGVGYGLN